MRLLLAAIFFIVYSTTIFATEHLCPSTTSNYERYALYNAEDYFWVFQDYQNYQNPKANISMITLVNPKDTSNYFLAIFNEQTIFGWSDSGGITTSLNSHMQERFKKMHQDKWLICERSTTILGMKQYKNILKNKKLAPNLSNQ